MVTSPINIKNKINSKLFNSLKEYNRLVTIRKHDKIKSFYGNQSNISEENEVYAITLDYKKFKTKYDKAGKYNSANFIILLNADVGLTKDDLIVIEEVEYKIVDFEEPLMGETILLTRAFIEEN